MSDAAMILGIVTLSFKIKMAAIAAKNGCEYIKELVLLAPNLLIP